MLILLIHHRHHHHHQDHHHHQVVIVIIMITIEAIIIVSIAVALAIITVSQRSSSSSSSLPYHHVGSPRTGGGGFCSLLKLLCRPKRFSTLRTMGPARQARQIPCLPSSHSYCVVKHAQGKQIWMVQPVAWSSSHTRKKFPSDRQANYKNRSTFPRMVREACSLAAECPKHRRLSGS